MIRRSPVSGLAAPRGPLPPLTQRQRDVLRLVALGRPNKEIARGLESSGERRGGEGGAEPARTRRTRRADKDKTPGLH
ncbi:LuxR C-terminal-related transcriptional regulator, partial [Methylobacterium radiotolerans]|uniref:LuxR C-terminal-related transcriptional regulator n=1 Tax=Methylobacterium radiotolerans TaxID=31998 RepID=UPI002477D3BB